MKYPAYPKYKDSGVEWLGEVPEHWGVGKLGFEASVKARLGWKGLKAEEYVDEGYVFLSTPNIKDNCIDFDNVNYITEERYFESPEIMICQGDVLIAKDGSTTGITNVVRHLPSPATVNSSLAVLRPKDGTDSVYLYYWMLSSFTQFVIKKMQGGMGVPHLFQADLKKFSLLLPSLPEQRAIAAFLDAQTSKLDTLIAKKRELIDKLKEKRATLITRTVTRGLPPEAATAAGLDPHPKMKDSGVEWLGEVPEHWDVNQLQRICLSIQTGPFGSLLHQSDYIEGGTPLVNPINIVDGSLVADDSSTVDDRTVGRLSLYSLQKGDIVFARRGEIGRCGVVESQNVGWICGTGSMVVRINNNFSPQYVVAVCRTPGFSNKLELDAVGTTMKNINPAILGRMLIPFPSLPEQRAIVTYLDRETATLDGLVAKVETAIDRLQEYRAALITAAVTGQIDVREAVQ